MNHLDLTARLLKAVGELHHAARQPVATASAPVLIMAALLPALGLEGRGLGYVVKAPVKVGKG